MTALPGLTSPLPSLILENLVVTNYANLPGGSSTGLAFGGVYTALGTEAPSGFSIPVAGLPPTFVVIPMVYSTNGFIAASSSQSALTGHISVTTAAQLSAGDLVVFIIAPL